MRIATQGSDIARAHFMVQVENMSADTFIWVDETGSDKRNALIKYALSRLTSDNPEASCSC